MSDNEFETVLLYGDNAECCGEIDRGTLQREWKYYQSFPNLLTPRRFADEDANRPRGRPFLRLVVG